MLPTKFNRPQQSKAHLLMLRALGCDHETPDSSETAALAALAEVIALHSNGCDFTLGEIFTLSNNVMMHRDYVVGPNGFAIYDLRSLQESVLDPMATLAIRIGRASCRERVSPPV